MNGVPHIYYIETPDGNVWIPQECKLIYCNDNDDILNTEEYPLSIVANINYLDQIGDIYAPDLED